jgi:hypothetical protein
MSCFTTAVFDVGNGWHLLSAGMGILSELKQVCRWSWVCQASLSVRFIADLFQTLLTTIMTMTRSNTQYLFAGRYGNWRPANPAASAVSCPVTVELGQQVASKCNGKFTEPDIVQRASLQIDPGP